ncbi:hypothetical protein BA93_05125 [Finegoldia magna ALB8]|nr:hypothetical protein BA93_05125 [Finegoldia magna ALB8]
MRGARAPLFLMRLNGSQDIYVLPGRGNKKVVAHSSGLQKLLKVASEQVKVENQFARISRLRK